MGAGDRWGQGPDEAWGPDGAGGKMEARWGRGPDGGMGARWGRDEMGIGKPDGGVGSQMRAGGPAAR